MTEVQFSINACLSRSVKEIQNQRKWITILLHDSIQSPIINTKTEASILLGEENGSSVHGTRQVNKSCFKILVDELMESGEFRQRKGVDVTDQRFLTINSFDLEVEFAMQREVVSLLLRENISEVVILWRQTGEVQSLRQGGSCLNIGCRCCT